MNEILYKDECYRIQGAAFEVYKEMGNGFLEAVYQECLEQEFRLRDIYFVTQQPLTIQYKGALLKQSYNPDFICFNTIIVELKGVSAITKEHQAQVLNYLKATGLKLGIILNFGAYPGIEIKRIVF